MTSFAQVVSIGRSLATVTRVSEDRTYSYRVQSLDCQVHSKIISSISTHVGVMTVML